MSEKKLSRRDFLRIAGTSAAGSVMLTRFSPLGTAFAEAPAQDIAEVELFWHMAEYESWANDIMTPIWNEMNPDIPLTWTFVNDPENETVLSNRMAAGNPPAVFVIIGGPSIQWLKDDLLVDMAPFEELEENTKHYPESAFEFPRLVRETAGFPREGIWGYPTMKVMTGFVYHNDKFEELGLEAPTTYDELWEVLRALQDSGEFNHAIAWGNHRWMTYNNFWEVASALVSHDVGEGILTGKYKLDSDEMVEVWKYYERIAQEGLADPDWTSLEWGIQEANFANQQYGAILQGPWVFTSYPKINPEVDLRAVPFPTRDGENRAWVGFLESRNWWMPKEYPNRDAQVKAMQWITSEAYADRLIEDAGIMPMYQKDYDVDAPVIEYMDKQGFPLASQANDTVDLFIPPGKQGFWAFTFENLPKLTSGELTAAEYGALVEEYYKEFRKA